MRSLPDPPVAPIPNGSRSLGASGPYGPLHSLLAAWATRQVTCGESWAEVVEFGFKTYQVGDACASFIAAGQATARDRYMEQETGTCWHSVN